MTREEEILEELAALDANVGESDEEAIKNQEAVSKLHEELSAVSGEENVDIPEEPKRLDPNTPEEDQAEEEAEDLQKLKDQTQKSYRKKELYEIARDEFKLRGLSSASEAEIIESLFKAGWRPDPERLT